MEALGQPHQKLATGQPATPWDRNRIVVLSAGCEVASDSICRILLRFRNGVPIRHAARKVRERDQETPTLIGGEMANITGVSGNVVHGSVLTMQIDEFDKELDVDWLNWAANRNGDPSPARRAKCGMTA
jgi:hypothetical protein